MGDKDRKSDLQSGFARSPWLEPGKPGLSVSGAGGGELSPLAKAFNRMGEKNPLPDSVPFMGTAPVSYSTYLGEDGRVHLDGKRGIEYRLPDSDVRFLAGSYLPAAHTAGVEHWTAEVAWTPINMNGLKMGPMLGDVAKTDMRAGGAGFERIGPSVGFYATTDDKQGGLFAKIQTDPDHGNNVKAFVGFKLPFNGR